MGLYAEYDIIKDWGLPSELSGGDDEIGYESVAVNYSNACKAFVTVFMRAATKMVPVDTGYLRSTIKAYTDGDTLCYAEATAEYAECVEYGTWCMSAQPYFEPALEEACAAAAVEAQIALQEAQEMLEFMLDIAYNAARATSKTKGGSFGGFFLGLLFAMAIILFTAPIWLPLQSVMSDMRAESFSYDRDYGSGFIPQVIIT